MSHSFAVGATKRNGLMFFSVQQIEDPEFRMQIVGDVLEARFIKKSLCRVTCVGCAKHSSNEHCT